MCCGVRKRNLHRDIGQPYTLSNTTQRSSNEEHLDLVGSGLQNCTQCEDDCSRHDDAQMAVLVRQLPGEEGGHSSHQHDQRDGEAAESRGDVAKGHVEEGHCGDSADGAGVIAWGR